MKRLSAIIAVLLLTLGLFAQLPERMSYQAVIRSNSNVLVVLSPVGMRVSILQGSPTGTPVYVERQTPTTNGNGLISIEIGSGSIISGDFTTIDWSTGTYFIKTEVDPSGGSSYTITGTSQLLSVPYALHSKASDNLKGSITESQISDLQSYLKSESDPVFGSSPAQGISNGNITNWNTAYGWGNHASAGYLTGFTETDPIFGVWDKSSGIGITALQVSDFQSSVTNNTSVLANTAKNSYPSADQIKVSNISGTNTGDETTTTIKTKLGITTLSGSNTGDQNLASVLTQGTDAGNKKIINVNQQGIGTSTPNAGAALEISSITQGFLPPRMTQAQRDAITSVNGLIVFNTGTKRPNYYDGNDNEWKNFDGTSARTIPVAIGDSYQGGKVAYILQSGDAGYVEGQIHGLIAAPSDQIGIVGAEWGCIGIEISGADGKEIGTGNQNTKDIVTGCTTAGIAAKLCYDLTLNGYSDWYLPSKDELNNLYLNKVAVGGFSNGSYWSSTEDHNISYAWLQRFSDGIQNNILKSATFYVRAIRAF